MRITSNDYMKQLIPVLVIVMLIKPLWPFIQYTLNYNYIVENLCENKNKPALNCNGKCFLAKQIAKESKEKDKTPLSSELSKLELPIINWFNEQNIAYTFFGFVVHNYKSCNKLKYYLFTTDIAQPPELA